MAAFKNKQARPTAQSTTVAEEDLKDYAEDLLTELEPFQVPHTESLAQIFNSRIPDNCIKTRPGGGRNGVQYLSRNYLVTKMNSVFGVENWTCEISKPELITENSFICKAVITVKYKGESFTRSGWGTSEIKQNQTANAMKACATDAFKRAAVYFGSAMGLQLSDK